LVLKRPFQARHLTRPSQIAEILWLEIAADGSYRMNSEAVAAPALRERLIAIFERRGERVLFMYESVSRT
jgi:hypothetical protein